jgi:hypothetical protein
MVIDVYWDLLGNFLRYELPAGESLTKLDHQELTAGDHEQLQKILSDKGSILRDYPAEDLIDRRIVKSTDKKVDAVTSATRVDVKAAVVPGAVYSTYVLWYIVNGPTPLGLPYTLSRSPLRRLASASAESYGETSPKRLRREGGPFAWLASLRSLARHRRLTVRKP